MEKKNSKKRFSRVQKKEGSILIAVLWSLFFLAALALTINVLITSQLGLAAKLRDRMTLRYLAKAGIARAIIEIRADETEGYDAVNDPWGANEEAFKEIGLTDEGYFSLEYLPPSSDEDGKKQYGLIDEERKLNINRASVEVLKQFFEIVAKVSSQDAVDIADAIADWRDEDDEPLENGAESPYYEALENGYACKDAPFEILEELMLVKGMTQPIFDKLKDRITVYGAGAVNINTVDTMVLEGLGLESDLACEIVSFRSGNDGLVGTEDDNVFQDTESILGSLSSEIGLSPANSEVLEGLINSGIIGVRSDYFRGYSFGRFRDADMSVRIAFVIDRDEKIRYWREE
ncbi:MAG: general secretion pathway protein GspK [Candidatus Omnitrophica bacterium]|nr:general secretion pathway protein GspK [Candidatus Omnitrophota bacterium]